MRVAYIPGLKAEESSVLRGLKTSGIPLEDIDIVEYKYRPLTDEELKRISQADIAFISNYAGGDHNGLTRAFDSIRTKTSHLPIIAIENFYGGPVPEGIDGRIIGAGYISSNKQHRAQEFSREFGKIRKTLRLSFQSRGDKNE